MKLSADFTRIAQTVPTLSRAVVLSVPDCLLVDAWSRTPREVEGDTVAEALDRIFFANPALRSYVLDDQGALRRHMVIFVDGLPVKYLGREHDADVALAAHDFAQMPERFVVSRAGEPFNRLQHDRESTLSRFGHPIQRIERAAEDLALCGLGQRPRKFRNCANLIATRRRLRAVFQKILKQPVRVINVARKRAEIFVSVTRHLQLHRVGRQDANVGSR